MISSGRWISTTRTHISRFACPHEKGQCPRPRSHGPLASLATQLASLTFPLTSSAAAHRSRSAHAAQLLMCSQQPTVRPQQQHYLTVTRPRSTAARCRRFLHARARAKSLLRRRFVLSCNRHGCPSTMTPATIVQHRRSPLTTPPAAGSSICAARHFTPSPLQLWLLPVTDSQHQPLLVLVSAMPLPASAPPLSQLHPMHRFRSFNSY